MADMDAFREEIARWAAGGAGDTAGDLAADLVGDLGLRTAVLLEGPSDLAAVEALAARADRDLTAEGVAVVSMGGAMSVGRFAGLLGPPGLGLRLTGLCDAREEPFYVRGWQRAGAPRDFHVCVADLEDELIRALGTERVEEVIRAEDELRPWQTFLAQPAQHGRSRQQQLRRFLSTRKGRKIRYGSLLVEALDTGRPPAPLADLLAGL
ncbi:TOPRIM nucleotidyl transferase/hydrolase domain-containing protein [Streptomyces sp. NPDC060275]|uniref:TOPRIM nucleotidyl transferase/hydrolase domain-containing protein n=1 Tax=Streptomyces sp. NPDC060275 TaxID=3347090 RepID=UPI003662AD8D